MMPDGGDSRPSAKAGGRFVFVSRLNSKFTLAGSGFGHFTHRSRDVAVFVLDYLWLIGDGMNRVPGLLTVLVVLLGIVQPDVGRAATPTFDPSQAIEDCAEPCHRWLIEDRARVVTVDLKTPFSGEARRVQYGAGWIAGESCPAGRIEIARRIQGFRSGSVFVEPLLRQGFCPRVILEGVSNDAPYLGSLAWSDVVLDAERARMLTRAKYDRSVVPPLRKLLASQEPSRWVAFSLFVGAAVPNADLLTEEIAGFLADPNPSTHQLTLDGQSDKATNIRRVSDFVTSNDKLVDALLNELDTNPIHAVSPGYRGLIDNLAGITSSMPTWGSPPVCANVDRIARHLPWGGDVQRDAQFLATLSRCETGSENLLRQSLQDERPTIVATGLRVWWAAAAVGQAAAGNVAENVIGLVTRGGLPHAAAAPVHVNARLAQTLIRGGTAAEDVALGLSTLGLLSGTVERLNAVGRADQARALFDGLERGMQRLVR
jgi:hypothetical protein